MVSQVFPLSTYFPTVSRIAYGCMGLGGGWDKDPITTKDISHAHSVIDAAMSYGINFFDHADIYRLGKAEQVFGEVLKQKPELRDSMIIQSKCGIRFKEANLPGRYDFSEKWIKHSVEGSLRRLNTEYLDILMLHRPDPLMQIHELAETLMTLQADGKVKHFAVSNMNQFQVEFLQKNLDTPIIANQIEMSLGKLDWLNDGVLVGSDGNNSVDFVSGTLEYCQTKHIQLQAWGCLAQGKYSEQGLNSECEHIRRTSKLVLELAQKHHATAEAVVLAFLMKHPSNIQPIIGTTNLERIKGATMALDFELTRDEWYSLFVSARGEALP
ncbi:aldo/keto reductase [Pseudoalteromonas phenolica]|uniref:Aldo/keto reductase n=1 Tax=Pseudoalteromonas phenolica TaxID=161398 RepID=A0A0S2K2Q0_9GAMM|nr:aldo/keto reductase [Pseudoalteromonas phenolica]ALO42545.1 Aldo/keto reductase [Pseudoalteromonas phenolica]MBE0356350.1 hypothetical protein [Pseudoalteromonas phenolica O-BC30]